MTEESITKGYDPVIMKRLFRYGKPYAGWIAAAVLALLLGTAAELGIPLVLRHTVDNVLLSEYYRIAPDTARDRMLDRNVSAPDIERVAGDGVFLSPKAVGSLGVSIAETLRQKNELSTEAWFVLSWPEDRAKAIAMLRQSNIEYVADELRFALPQDRLWGMTVDKQLFLRSSHMDMLVLMSFLFLGLLIVSVIFAFLQIYAMAVTGQGVMKDLRIELFSKTMSQSSRFLQNNPIGKLVTRVTNDVETINELFTSVLTSLVKDIALMAGVLVTLFAIDWRLALWTISILPVLTILTIVFRAQARKTYRKVRRMISSVNAFLSEHLSGMHIVQLFVKEKKTREEFASKNQDLLRANLGEMYIFAVFRPMVDFLATLSTALIIYVGAGQHLEGLMSVGVLIAFINLIAKFYEPVMDISEKFNLLQSAMAGGERVFALLDTNEHVPDNGALSTPEHVAGGIEFDRVDFAYKSGEPVLRSMSFSVNAGEKVAIVGYTGSGKTTIANLLTRMWDIDDGTIRIDGIDIRNFKLSQLRKTVQPVQQDVFLFSDSIRENITMGKFMPDKDLETILAQVQASDFIASLPDGLDTVLNEGASSLSSGQRQLISFARILAQDPRIIVMDEATSSIDTETERRIQIAMKTVMRDRTSLVIAHRLSTIKDADRILVLGAGTIIESGTHEELMAAEGFYHNLYRIQFSDAEAAQDLV